jgi:hypothetical protein
MNLSDDDRVKRLNDQIQKEQDPEELSRLVDELAILIEEQSEGSGTDGSLR